MNDRDGGTPSDDNGVLAAGKAPPLGRYPHARRAGGFVFVSGTSARRPDGVVEGGADIRLQTAAVIENVRDILAAAGGGLRDLVQVTVYLTDMADFGGYNEVYARYFDQETGPARTTVEVSRLPHPGLLIEMQAVAHPRAEEP
ncbi:RidA family protein [Spongiactinospora sp. TRM90649]|uniref:RidA family protein n=1 Tax=Spongiactinospora sp. TRM90649 TaxID=3031114 RepID=UPI0023F8B23B|nr:RidA family protein [Spongiactinospora sp. TRM90649]MDF5758528.1 RidA family protein [Spongiactinospora sp. TRM90649]